MSIICLNNIISVRDHCQNQLAQSSSGYDLMDAPEINLAHLNDVANAEYLKGLNLLKNCVRLAIRDLETDFIQVLHANNFTANLHAEEISTGVFSSEYSNNGTGLKGIVLHKNNVRGIKKLKVSKIRIYPQNDHESATIKIIDSGRISELVVQLVGGRINEFLTDYVVEGNDVKILMEGVETLSSQLTCLLGCHGSVPNSCGYVKGWNGSAEIQKEGFGINAVFTCECDYSQILCRQSKSYVGKLLWLKARINVLEERVHSSRLNPFIIYGSEDAKKQRIELIQEYNADWNIFIDTIPHAITNDECFNCTGAKLVTNV